MKEYPLIGGSICVVVLLVLGSFSTVSGYQTVQSSHQEIALEAVDQEELLFQTLCDVANNKEIQRIILKSQMGRGVFSTSEFAVVTKNQLKMMYIVGLALSKVISTSRIQSIVWKFQFNNQEIQKEISAVIEKDATLHRETTQVFNSECDCDIEKKPSWDFPVLCKVLGATASLCWLLTFYFGGPLFPHLLTYIIMLVCVFLGMTLHCDWIPERIW